MISDSPQRAFEAQMGRAIVWFSCGAASAVAAKLAVEKYGKDNLHLVYCDTMASEHSDNRRFLRDVEEWAGVLIDWIRSEKYTSVDDVFERERYMSGPHGARCTVEMKKVPRFGFQQPDDLHIFGLTADETERIDLFEANNPELILDWILRDQRITKGRCYELLGEAGIKLPEMYRLGFKHNNCIGCVKASSAAYWDRVRVHFPAIFEKRAQQSREIGCRLVNHNGKRIFLDELPRIIADPEPELDFECGPYCAS